MMASNRKALLFLFCLLSVVMWEAVACGDLLVAPKGGRLDDLAKTGVKHTPDDIVKVIRKQGESLIDERPLRLLSWEPEVIQKRLPPG